jgi:hypothetical protein
MVAAGSRLLRFGELISGASNLALARKFQSSGTEGLCMTRFQMTTGLIIIATLGMIPRFAHAGPCSDDIAQFQQTMRQSAGNPNAGLMAPQSVHAQLDRQPTPGSLKRAEDRLHAKFSARMARAERLDKQGDRAGCMRALSAAKQMYIP